MQLINLLRFANLFTILSLAIVIVLLTIVLILKIDKIKKLQTMVDKLRKSLEEMDEQAKLIVRTDIELNKAQEELDKKITGLYALQRLSRIISTTLEESQIFKVIESTSFEDLGFEKAWVLLWDDKENKFIPQLNIGYLHDEIETIKPQVNSDKDIYLDLIKTGKTFSSISAPHNTAWREKINHIFKVNSFVVSPILPKEGSKGFFFVGTENMDVAITEGDEELITILSNQIGQALENARLFEKTWHAQQELEKKVEERTRELTFALDEVKKINKRKTDFISSVSHELRTPLTSIKGYAAILIEEKLGHLPPAAKERLEKINRHSDELVHMVNDLLDIARIESGRAIMKMEEQDLKTIISNVADLISIQCKNKNIELIASIQKDIPPVLADRVQLERVFINLLGNAVKFTPENGKITIKAHSQDNVIQVDISDTGIGIPPDSLSMIFEEFYRVDNPINQQVKGTGLGLSLVKHIIEAHKGKIWAESKQGKGSTFSFTLPVE
ncbi:MAG: ATP-binding protein [Candidatus Omnitrophota bacterium]|nr:ATP-binding protein [Candidatus Omnitrophota bacterium]